MTEPPGRQASTSQAQAMCKPGQRSASAPDQQDSQSDPDLAVPLSMNGHLVVDIVTLGLFVLAALLYLACRLWLKRKAVKAARKAEEALAAKAAREAEEALAAAASKVRSEASQTELPVFFGLDDAVNRLHQQLISHQHQLDSMEAQRLQWVNFNRLISLLPFPKPNLPKMDESFLDPADQPDGTEDVLGNVKENWTKYPPV